MAELTRTVRAPHEVAGLRALAEHQATGTVAQRSEYLQTRCTAVIATCDWIAGHRTLSPASESELRPDEHGLRLERMRGEDLEVARRRDGGDAVTPGVVAATILWFTLDPWGEPPL